MLVFTSLPRNAHSLPRNGLGNKSGLDISAKMNCFEPWQTILASDHFLLANGPRRVIMTRFIAQITTWRRSTWLENKTPHTCVKEEPSSWVAQGFGREYLRALM